MKKLKFWNGRPYGVLPQNQWKDRHIYIAAYSIADARRLCAEVGRDPGQNEFKEYFANCWGNAMNEVNPERGVWYVEGHRGTPVKLNPLDAAQ